MNAGVKLVIGVILVLIGLWLLVPVGAPVVGQAKPAEWTTISGFSLDWWNEFVTMLKGVIPPMIIIFGALVVWIESEELKTPTVPEIEQPAIEPERERKKESKEKPSMKWKKKKLKKKAKTKGIKVKSNDTKKDILKKIRKK